MRHLKSGKKLSRTASHRKAMLANLACSILDKERVTTTVTKAKEVRRVVERLISYGKKNSLHGRRLAAAILPDETVVKKLFDVIAPAFSERHGGYTRVLKLNTRRGDCAEMAIIELVGRRGEGIRKKPKKKRPSSRKKPAGTAPETAGAIADASAGESVSQAPESAEAVVQEQTGEKKADEAGGDKPASA